MLQIIKEAFCIKEESLMNILLEQLLFKWVLSLLYGERCEEIPTKWNEMIFSSRSLVDMRSRKKQHKYIRRVELICVKFFADLTTINKHEKTEYQLYLFKIDWLYIKAAKTLAFYPTLRSLTHSIRPLIE